MFDQAKVLYIIDNNVGLVNNIVTDLKKYNILENLFDDFVESSNKSFDKFIASLPRKTIFCANLNYNKDVSTKINIAIPFMSSHVNFPIKLGEVIWFYKYNSQLQNTGPYINYDIDGYYLGRVHSLVNTEDTSYTFAEREKTLFNTNNYDIEDEINDTKKGILETLEANDQYFINPETVVHKPEIESTSSLSGKILNNFFYKDTLKKYALPSIEKVLSRPEDLCLTGTYNTTINLTSTAIDDNTPSENIEIEPKKGKIEVIVGEKERLKQKSFRSTKVVKSVDMDGFISDQNDSIITTYNNDILPEIFNGIFNETIKTPNYLISVSNEDEDIKQNFVYIKEKSILDNSASLVVSEDNKDFLLIKQQLTYTIPTIDEMFREKTNNFSNLLHDASFTTLLPDIREEPQTSLGDNVFSSSVTSIADNFIFSTYERNDSEILLTTPNSDDGKSNYLRMTNTGNIHLNAKKIVIGDASRLVSDNGLNAGLFLGFSEDMQSLVLGEQLKAFIEEIISVQKETLNLTKELFIMSKDMDSLLKDSLDITNSKLKSTNNVIKEFSGAVDKATKSPPLSAVNPPFAALFSSLDKNEQEIKDNEDKIKSIPVDEYQTQINNFKALKTQGKESDNNSNEITGELLYKRLTKIEKSLDRILSKFTKTT
jgi:hypothetical protein